MSSPEDLMTWLQDQVAKKLGLEREAVGLDIPLDAFGLGSREAVELAADLNRAWGLNASATIVYDFPTLRGLCQHLAGQDATDLEVMEASPGEPIAIIGVGCRLPGAGEGPARLLKFLSEGRSGVREVPGDRWDVEATFGGPAAGPGQTCTRWAGLVDDIAGFEPEFFGIAPAEAERMDPHQRLVLEAVVHAIEDAGLQPSELAGTSTGVFVGVSQSEYGREQIAAGDIAPATATGSALSIVANRVSYLLDLQGPSLAIDTACSSSLVAAHTACESLRAGDCEFALAGGVNVVQSPDLGIALTAAGLMSPDGACHAFDDRANGYVRGEGVGIVLLQPLSRALAQGRPIYATIEGGAIVQDGRSQGLMAPRGPAQQKTIALACRRAGISPSQLDYVETHGTGTALGDVIEATALGAILTEGRERPCPIGSVKSNIGHLESAAGIAGLIKTALMLRTRILLPNHDFQNPNPKIPFADLNLEVQATTQPFAEGARRLHAGVSSFGFGGTNAHLVLASPPNAPAQPEHGPLLVGLSAPSAEALDLYRARVADALEDEQIDVALRTSWLPALSARTVHDHRLAVAGSDLGEIAQRLRRAQIGRAEAVAPRSVIFAYSGQGAMWPGVGRDLFQDSEPFRLALLTCDDAIRACSGQSVLPTLFGEESASRLADTVFAQPAIFALQVGLTAHLRALGITPSACVGHSVGEIAAAHAAGALDLQDAARVVCLRAGAMGPTRGLGAMVALRLSHAEAEARLSIGEALELAALNGPNSVVYSGSVTAIEALEARCREAGVERHRLPVDYAFHSRQMDEAAAALAQHLADLTPARPSIRLAAAIPGVGEDALRDAGYWARNVRETVAFEDAIRSLDDGGVVVEIGPHPVLGRDIEASLARPGAAIATLRRGGNGAADMLATLAQLFVAGALTRLPAAAALLAPPRAWARRPCWYAPSRGARTREARSSYLTHRTQLAAGGGEAWSGAIRFPDDLELLDHRIFGFPLMPAAAYVDIFLRVARALAGHDVQLEDVRFIEPLVLAEDQAVELQVAVQPQDDGWSLTLFARAEDTSSTPPWRRHASALARAGQASRPGPVALDRIRSRCFDQYPPVAFYDLLQRKGLEYGPRFQGLSSVVGVRGEALGRLKAAVGDARSHQIAPGLLDSALQATAATFGGRKMADADEAAPIPVRIERILAWDTGAPAEWSHVVGGKDEGSIRTADVTLLDGAGEASMRLEGVTLKSAQKGAAVDLETRAALDRWLYAIEWGTTPASEPVETNAVAVLCDDADLMGALLAQAHATGRSVLGLARTGSPAAEIDGVQSLRSWAGTIDACRAAGLRPDAVVAVIPVAEGDDPVGLTGLAETSGLVQTALGQATEPPRIVLVTRGAELVADADHGEVAAAGLFGFQRALLIEQPDLECALLDVERAASPSSVVAAIEAALARDASEPHLAWRDGEMRVPRLVRRRVAAALHRLDPDGVHLVTGANGALGAQAALGLAELGARRLWLTGRRPELVSALHLQLAKEHPQVEVRYSACDLSQRQQVRALISGVAEWGALKGVVHAAGSLDDTPIVALEPHHLERVLAPKSLAACWLDEELADTALSYFVAFSSAASVLGSPGQGNYCAANAQLDGLARLRARQGRPYLSISWGAWSGDGLARGSRLTESRLIDTIAPQVGRELLKRLLGESGHLLVFPTSLAALAQFYPSHGGLGLFREVAGAAIVSTRGGRAGERAYTRPDLPIEYIAPRNEIEQAIVGIWQRALGMTGIGVLDELFALGGDSVLASQILALVNKTYGIVIDPEEAYQSFTVERLAASVEDHLLRLVESLDEATVDELVSGA